MTTPSLRQQLASPNTRATAKEELRRRILEIVSRRHSLTDIAIWQESAPDYLPWNPMLEEIKSLDKEQKLRLETPASGHQVVHSFSTPPAATEPAMAGDCQPASTAQRSKPSSQTKSRSPKPSLPTSSSKGTPIPNSGKRTPISSSIQAAKTSKVGTSSLPMLLAPPLSFATVWNKRGRCGKPLTGQPLSYRRRSAIVGRAQSDLLRPHLRAR